MLKLSIFQVLQVEIQKMHVAAMIQPLFANRVGILATMHHKEQVIAPILEQKLGIQVIVPSNFNTDYFGTFTREVQRLGNQIETARLKAEKALAVTGETLAFASEGTFGPHPAMPFIACNREVVVLLDTANQLEIIGQQFSTETNYSHRSVDSVQAAEEFAHQVGFPEHALVVMATASPTDTSEIIKEITTKEQLESAVTFFLNKSGNSQVHIETDMRALYNPTRMKNIAKATHDLIKKISDVCPKCSLPSWELVQKNKGLRCAACNLPTELTLSIIYRCKKCNFTETLFPDRWKKADPSQCMYCNP